MFLTNCRLADGQLVDIGIAGGKITAVVEGAVSLSNSASALDIGGDFVLPGLVDGHMHLDKILTGLPWMGQATDPTRIETDKTVPPHLRVSTHPGVIQTDMGKQTVDASDRPARHTHRTCEGNRFF